MRWRPIRWSICCWLVALWLAGGCDEDPASQELEGRVFLLESSQGFEPLAGTRVYLTFEADDFGFHAGCNSHSGSFTLRGGRLVVGELGSTEIGCDPARHTQDEWLAQFVTSSPRLQLEGNRLTLTGAQATLVFLDREVADPDRPLVGTPWTIDSFIDADAVSDLPLTTPPTIVFRDDATLQVETTCNTGTGQFSVAANRITLTNVVFTESACNGGSAYADAHIRTVISDGALTFEIEAARLTLQRGDSGISAMGPPSP